MSTSPLPQPITIKTSVQNNDVATATSVSDLQRAIQNLTVRVSKHSPPNANDLNEMQLIFDKTTLKLWIQVNGVGHYVQFT